MPETQGNSKDGRAPSTGRRPAEAAARREAVGADETRRLAALQKLRDLVPQDQPRLNGICRVAALISECDAAGLAFLSDRFLYFTGRFGVLPDRDVRGFAIEDIYNKLVFIPDARLLAGQARMACFNGKFATYRSMIGVAVYFEAQPVAMLSCFSEEAKDTYSPDVKACLYEMAYLAEAQLAQAATLANLARTATLAMERLSGVEG